MNLQASKKRLVAFKNFFQRTQKQAFAKAARAREEVLGAANIVFLRVIGKYFRLQSILLIPVTKEFGIVQEIFSDKNLLVGVGLMRELLKEAN